jgi:hypothetical protein
VKLVHVIFVLLILVGSCGIAEAQEVFAATREPLQVGFGWSFATPDYGTRHIQGFTAFGDVPFAKRLSLEATVHYVSLITPRDLGENTYLIGPRYTFRVTSRTSAYAKVLGGLAQFEFQDGYFHYDQHTVTNGAVALGGGIEFRASSHLNIRVVDFEYQVWPGFSEHGLTPTVTTIGFAYVR